MKEYFLVINKNGANNMNIQVLINELNNVGKELNGLEYYQYLLERYDEVCKQIKCGCDADLCDELGYLQEEIKLIETEWNM